MGRMRKYISLMLAMVYATLLLHNLFSHHHENDHKLHQLELVNEHVDEVYAHVHDHHHEHHHDVELIQEVDDQVADEEHHHIPHIHQSHQEELRNKTENFELSAVLLTTLYYSFDLNISDECSYPIIESLLKPEKWRGDPHSLRGPPSRA